MRKRLINKVVAAIFLLAAGAPGVVSSTVSAAAMAPLRVLSLNLCADHWLLALAEEGQIAGLSYLSSDPNLSPYADAAARYPSVQAELEAVIAAVPELVIVSPYGHDLLAERLHTLGYTVWALPEPDSLAAVGELAEAIGQKLGREAAGKAWRAAWQGYMQARPVPPTLQPAILWHEGGMESNAYGWQSELWARLGYRLQPASAPQSLEALVAAPEATLLRLRYYPDAPSQGGAQLQHPVMQRHAIQRDIPGWATLCAGPALFDWLKQSGAEGVQ